MATLKELLEQLPPDLQEEAKDFVEFLLQKRGTKERGELNFQWRGALRELRDGYTSVELQHKALQLWGD